MYVLGRILIELFALFRIVLLGSRIEGSEILHDKIARPTTTLQDFITIFTNFRAKM